MPTRSDNYKLEYFRQGGYYSARSDRRRFLTIDYNLQSYIGIAGIGVISGWTIESLGGLKVQIIPGDGVVNGFYVESPFTVKQRSDMVPGDREVSVMPSPDGEPQDDLTPSQRATYVSVVQLYDPSFNPVGPIENAYVKVVVPTELTLSNNTDSYIYAERPSDATPYPPLEDYPPPAGLPPVRREYSSYADYQVALAEYNAKLDAIHDYQWYTNPDNHFTAVDFVIQGSRVASSNRVYLGRVVTRSGEVTKIDTDGVDNLASMYAEIKSIATDLLVAHRHGGSQPFDPPKVRLETDIREGALASYDKETGRAIYSVMSKVETSIELGHKHTYQVDEDGNGQTIDQIGSTNAHFHKITEGVVEQQENSADFVKNHTHTIETEEAQGDTWTSTSPYVVYVNGDRFGDETSTNLSVNATTKRITFENGISSTFNKYSTNFEAYGREYSYEAREVSVLSFMLRMIADFNRTFAEELALNVTRLEGLEATAYQQLRGSLGSPLETGTDPNVREGGDEFWVENGEPVVEVITASEENRYLDALNQNPFIFSESGGSVSDGNWAGIGDLVSQSSAAQQLLREEGDRFVFTPNAADNISITLEELGTIDEVTIEILGNVEVTGKLRPESIIYLNANKILSGEFIPEVIPFISHVGRLEEEFLPFQYPLVSDDAVRFQAVPAITDVSLDHYHKLFIGQDWSGATSDTMVGNEAVYYQEDEDGNTYFIAHAHGVSEGTVNEAEKSGLLEWQNNVGSTITTSEHTHNMIIPAIGNAKAIYALKEDVNGNIYVGTSDGFIVIPDSDAYQFVMNGVDLYFYGNDLWDLLQKARLQYEAETGNPFFLTERVYLPQVTKAEELLNSDGDSVLLENTIEPDRQGDQVMITKISHFKMPNFKYIDEKNEFEVTSLEQVVSGPDSSGNVIVEREFNDVPIWSIEIKTALTEGASYVSSTLNTDLIVVGSNLVSRSIGIERTPYQPWNAVDLPFSVGVNRNLIKASDGSYWMATNGGVLVSRDYANGDAFDVTNLPGGNPDIKDLLEGEKGTIYTVSPSGIFTTMDGGKTWSKKFDVINGFIEISRDFTLDKTTTVDDHYHTLDVDIEGNGFSSESIGSGTTHVHKIDSWDIASTLGHTHTLIVTLYAVDDNKIIYRSIDNGETWSSYGELPQGENGSVFPAFGNLFVSQDDGLYSSSDGSAWDMVLQSKIFSYEWAYDMDSFFLGGDNIVYSTYNGSAYETVYSFGGYPSTILLEQGSRKHFGYAYSNMARVFHFKDFLIPEGDLTALIDFGQWLAQEGSWDAQDPYDVYIDYRRVLSTKYEEDNRVSRGYNFEVNASDGLLDFSAETTLTAPVSIYDNTIEVESSDGFSVGDQIAIGPDDNSIYVNITAINGDTLTMSLRASESYDISEKVVKIPNLNGDTSVLLNIYNSLLSNIGTLTHDDIEDGLSNYSDGRPYKFNDSYLSNLLQLTQAVRYVYPDINSDFINDIFYDFRYSESTTDPLYPYIGDYIDTLTSSIYNQKFYESPFTRKKAKAINRVLIGYGSFAGTIIVATDIGIFWAKLVPNLEANWFYINDLPFTVNDIVIFGGTRLIAATENGTYYTDDMVNWVREKTGAMNFATYAIGLRWVEDDVITIPSHTAKFNSDSTNDKGSIVASSGTPYVGLQFNEGIKITGAGDKNGSYIIEEVKDAGSGYGSGLIVSPAFDGRDGTKSGVVITQGTWWTQWDGDENTSNVNLTNTLLIGGTNSISYNNGGGVWAWLQAKTEAENFIARYFLPLSNGKVLAASTGNDASNQKNYLFDSNDIGRNWNIFRDFEEVRGNIVSSEISDFDNTVIKVEYTQPSEYVYVNGILDQQEIAIYQSDSTVAIFSGFVVWNEKRDGFDKITIYGNEANAIIDGNSDYTFRVFPNKVNTMAETSDETIFFGTNKGLYYDVNTVVGNVRPEGTIINPGVNGAVQSIDVSGSIISLSTNAVTNNTVMSVKTNTPIRGDELAGKKMYITDTDPVESFDILNSTSVTVGGESTIEIEVSDPLTSDYVGKRFRLVGSQSRIQVNFDLPVLNNQFNGGKFFITSDEFNNVGKSYDIVENGTNYIDISEALIPTTTLVSRNEDGSVETTISTDGPLQEGQSIRLVDSNGDITLWVSLDRSVKENTLKDLDFEFSVQEEDGTNLELSIPIKSNLKNSITLNTEELDVVLLEQGIPFAIDGVIFEQLPGFSLLKTSLDSDHYHDVQTVGAFVRGKISSFGATDASFVTFDVSDTQNFDDPLVQLRGDLFKDAQIVFTTEDNVNMRYLSDVVSHDATSITVRLKNSSYWSFSSTSEIKISEGWDWEIDATNYGYTEGITYDDFVVISRGITENASRGDDEIKVESTTGIAVGDKLRLQDDTLSFEINYVSQVVDDTTLKLESVLSRTFFFARNPQIKVLRDTFSNTHIHQVRGNEVEVINIEAYLDNGYPSNHSHRVLPLIPEVSTLLNSNNSILSFGSGSIIYRTIDNGVTWKPLVDLDDFIEGGSDVEFISTAALNGDDVVAGAANGSLFGEVSSKYEIVKLEEPL